MDLIITALGYDGSVLDTVLNAVVLIAVLTALSAQRRSPWWIVLIVMAVLQVALWLAAGAVGFSVVWAGLAGAVVVELGVRSGSRPRQLSMLVIALVVVLAAIIYYAVTLPLITTIAHLLALVLGVGIQMLARRILRTSGART